MNAPGAAAVPSYQPVTIVRAQNASSARTAACSSRLTNSSFIRIVSVRRINTCSRTQRISTRGAGIWSYLAALRMRWYTLGKMSRRCSTAAPGNACWATRMALTENHRVRRNSPDRRRPAPRRYPPWYRHRRIPGYRRSRNYPCRYPAVSSWITYGISISKRQRSPRPRHLARSHFRPTPCPGWPSGVPFYSPVRQDKKRGMN